MEQITNDGFFGERHTTKYYLKQLAKLGCPEDLVQQAREITAMKPHTLRMGPKDGQQVVTEWDGSRLYSYDCGPWGFIRIQIEPECNGYVDFGYVYTE
jgi:hypothetical protein